MRCPSRTLVALIALAAAVTLAAAPGKRPPAPWIPDRGDGTYRNPVIHADYSDPDVVRVGDEFIMVASSFNAVPGLPILRSRDLVNWRLVGHALPRLSPESLFSVPQHGKGPWAPAIRQHAGRLWVYYPEPDLGIFAVSAADPAGPWSEPVLVKAGRGLIDPCPFWDDDGRAYLVHAWARSRAGFANVLTLNRLDPGGLHVLDEGRVIIDGNQIPGYTTLEGPKLYKHAGYYWVFAPAGGVKPGWQSVFRSRTIDGPYESRIVLAQGTTDINGPHQGAWVRTPAGEDWFIHFQDLGAYGRVVHLQPMAWRDDGWPVMGRDADGDGTGEPVRTSPKPRVASPVPVQVPPTSDRFDARRLGPQWQWQANPRAAWLSLRAVPGRLRLYSQPTPAFDNLWMAPHLLLQKFPAPEFTATATLRFSPRAEAETAGLVVFGQDYAWIGLRRTAGRVRLVVRSLRNARDPGAGAQEVESASVAGPPGPVRLRVTVGQGGVCRFSVAFGRSGFEPLGSQFVAQPGMWVGAKVGLFASAPENTTRAGHADWDQFEIEGVVEERPALLRSGLRPGSPGRAGGTAAGRTASR